MTEDYVERRRAYVAEVRNSFDEESAESIAATDRRQPLLHTTLFSKIRLLVAVILFILFAIFRFTGSSIKGLTAEDVIDMIEDNHYYTKLKEYVTINGNR